MSLFKKIIFTGLSPNMTRKDVQIALTFLLLLWNWRRIRTGGAYEKAEAWLRDYFGVQTAITCDSGRSALYLGLKALGVKLGDEVILQAYTCVVVTNAIRFAGGVPVYVDVDDKGNMDSADLIKRITPKARILIIQHTFGRTANLPELLRIAKEKNLRTVEDCAHAFGTVFQGKKVGTFADLSMLSFGTEKVLSCARGGAVITNDATIGEALQKLKAELKPSPLGKVLQHLFHYPIFSLGRALYGIGLGKLILAKANFFHIAHRIIYPPEKRGERLPGYPSLLPNSLATILLGQLQNIDATNAHRREIGQIYEKELNLPSEVRDSYIPLRFPLFVNNAKEILNKTKKTGILLGDWYSSVVAPDDSTTAATAYTLGSCPNAEELSAKSVNLPTDIHISHEDARRIAGEVKKFL